MQWVHSLIFNTASMKANPLSVWGSLENLCIRNQHTTLQRSILPSSGSFGKFKFYFLALLNLLQPSGWICCACALHPNLLWHNSLSLRVYLLLFPHPCSRCHQQVDKSSKPKKRVHCSRNQKHPHQKKTKNQEKQKRRKNMYTDSQFH